jgi:phenylpropionate dioxygenase-like ring-hydroxylating dioxygenase large terminal subunit
MANLLADVDLIARILDHIDRGTTDLVDEGWREPVANFLSPQRLARELEQVLRPLPVAFCPSAALPAPGDHVARTAAGVPLLAVRGADGVVRAFRNACRHRGAEVARGRGRSRALVCPYHAWTFDLNGALAHVPHGHGFPGLDRTQHGLVPIACREHGGLVYVAHKPAFDADDTAVIDAMPAMLPADAVLLADTERDQLANWKVVAEAFLEGYHIRPTHRETFFPVQFDNLNVVERFGRNSRVTFPYRNVQKWRGRPQSEWQAGGVLTCVYHLFPNVMIATFPKRTVMAVLEPAGVDRTRVVSHSLAPRALAEADAEGIGHDTHFVNAGAQEDQDVVESIQRGLASGANDCLTYGLFEGAIVHLHRQLRARVDAGA